MLRLIAALAMMPQAATVQTPPPAASQNPSPMQEATRAHGRLTAKELEGVKRTFTGPGGKPVEVFVPGRARQLDSLDLVVHFHGAAWLPEQAVAGLAANSIVVAVVNLGAGSGAYDRAFSDPAAFDSLLSSVTREVSAAAGKPTRIGRVTLVGFSAGHGAIRAVLREPRHFARVGAILLLDGMHTSYVPEGSLLATGATLDTTNLVAFANFARAAVKGEKRFLVTHSEIFPGTFASTTETADWLLRAISLKRTPVLTWGHRGMQQLSEVRAGGFELLGYAGNSGPDHIDHLHAMPELLDRLLRVPEEAAFPRAMSGEKKVHHFIFFGQDRDKLANSASFLSAKNLEGAQVAYTWKQLEPQKDRYDFSMIRDDLALLSSNRKKLFVQLQDVSFYENRINVPNYLLNDPAYNGGADKQYDFKDDDVNEERPIVGGWMARRWDPAVQARFHKLLLALGKEFDGRIEGVNFAESSIGVGSTGRHFPKGFSFERYRDALIENMAALKRAFPKSVTIQYGNFMPGEWRPTSDKGYLRSVYKAAADLGVGVGGPDLLPFRPGQLKGPYPLIREVAGKVPVGIAVQDGNYADRNPKTGQPASIAELLKFATDELKVDYIFWCTEEPYYSRDVLPYLLRSSY